MTIKFLKKSNLESITSGLQKEGYDEIRIESTEFNHRDRIKILKFISDYELNYHKKIKNGETISFGSWILKLVSIGNAILEIWELTKDEHTFIKGADFTLNLMEQQRLICEKSHQRCILPTANQMVVSSPDVLSDFLVEGVRYDSPRHMSGWWLYTDTYDGDIKKMKPYHVGHLIAKRPDLGQYLGLPYGFRFQQKTESIWLDEEIKNPPSK